MEISGIPIPSAVQGFIGSQFDFSDAYDEDTEQIIHFYAPEHHKLIEPAIQDTIMGFNAAKSGFICSSDVVLTNVARDPCVDLTGTIVPHVAVTSQLDFAVLPIGSKDALEVNPAEVKLLFLFGSKEYNEDVRGRCASKGVNTAFFQSLMNDQEDFLKRLENVPVIGGQPTHPEYSISPRGYLVVGKKIMVHTKLIKDADSAGQAFHELHEEVDSTSARFSRPKYIGFVFGAFGSMQMHKRHYLNSAAWTKLQNEFPYTQFIGCSTTTIYSGNYPFNGSPNTTSVSIVIIEK